jgi:hypothetical protein
MVWLLTTSLESPGTSSDMANRTNSNSITQPRLFAASPAGGRAIWRPFKCKDVVELPDFRVILECVAEECNLDALTRVSIAHVRAPPFISVMTTERAT